MKLTSFLLLISFFLFTPIARAADTRPPNIVFILADDLGYNDVGCYGSFVLKTPNIDQLAKEGMRFTDFYCGAPVCTPSRAAFLTGCYPQRVHMAEFPPGPKQKNAKYLLVVYSDTHVGLNPSELIIPEILKTSHYTSHLVGKWHLGHEKPFLPVAQGFDTWFGLPYTNDMKPLEFWRQDKVVTDEQVDLDHITQRYTKEAIDVIKANKDHPFFLFLSHTMVHVPLGASENFRGKSAGGLYGDAVEELDWSVGEVLKTLKEQGLKDNTIVIYTSDNGPWHIKGEDGGNAFPLRAGKGTSYEGGVRVPFIVRWPGHVPAGSVNHEMAGLIDMLPTFAHIAGAESAVPADRAIDGKDVTPLFTDPSAKTPHEYVLYYAAGRLNGVRSGKWKLKLETALFEETQYDKVKNPLTPIDMKLYNLAVDPGEQKNVLKDHPDVVKKLLAYAEQAKEDIGDTRNQIEGKRSRPVGTTQPIIWQEKN